MIGFEKVWNSVKGRRTPDPVAPPVVPRGLKGPKAPVEVPSTFSEPSLEDTREANRFVPHKTATVLTTTAGRRVAARIINISRVGVAVEAELGDCGPEEIMTVGTRPVTPGRRIALGMVFTFKKPLDPKLCDPSIIL